MGDRHPKLDHDVVIRDFFSDHVPGKIEKVLASRFSFHLYFISTSNRKKEGHWIIITTMFIERI